MRIKSLLPTLVAVLLLSPAVALGSKEVDELKQFLYPPELIIDHRDQLNLDRDQEAAIREALRDTQSTVFDLRWQMKDEFEVLKELMQATPADEDAVVGQAKLVMDLEQQVKLTHLGMLLRLKNLMNDTQRAQLEEFRKNWSPKNN